MTTHFDSLTHPTALIAFAQQVQCDESKLLKSTGDTLTRNGDVIMWWVDDDLYAMTGGYPHASVWMISDVFRLTGPSNHTTYGTYFGLVYNGRLIGPQEVIHLVGCKPSYDPETGIAATRSRS